MAAAPGAARELRGDCARCSGLCCVVPAFDAAQGFGFDKEAHAPCRHLDSAHRCTIHEGLAAQGFTGCVVFECHGAGQWVTEHVAQGRSWRDSTETAARVFAAWPRFRALHELLAMVEAGGRALGAEAEGPVERLRARVVAACDAETVRPASVPIEPLRREVVAALRALAEARRPAPGTPAR